MCDSEDKTFEAQDVDLVELTQAIEDIDLEDIPQGAQVATEPLISSPSETNYESLHEDEATNSSDNEQNIDDQTFSPTKIDDNIEKYLRNQPSMMLKAEFMEENLEQDQEQPASVLASIVPKWLSLKNEPPVDESSKPTNDPAKSQLAGKKRGAKKLELNKYLDKQGTKIAKLDTAIDQEKSKEGIDLDQSQLKRFRSQKQACEQRKNQRKRVEKHKEHLEIILKFFQNEARDDIRTKFFDMNISEADFKESLRRP